MRSIARRGGTAKEAGDCEVCYRYGDGFDLPGQLVVHEEPWSGLSKPEREEAALFLSTRIEGEY